MPTGSAGVRIIKLDEGEKNKGYMQEGLIGRELNISHEGQNS